MDKNMVAEFKRIVGDKYVLETLEDRICYSFDASLRDCNPDLVLIPGTMQEVVKIVQLANRYGVPITPRGAATGISGGTVPLKGGISLGLTRLNKILEIDVANRVAVVEPGVITEEFNTALSETGLYYPPDPASSKMSTIGGNVAECAGGPHGVKYGITRDYVLGMEVVLPDGTVAEIGNPVDGDMSGPDWSMLFVGSEGTLGIITKIFLRLVDKPETKQTLMAIFDSLDNAAVAVSTIMASGTVPTTLEIMDNLTIRAVEDYLKAGLPVNAEALLLIEVDGFKVAVEKQSQQVIRVCKQCGASSVEIATTKEDMDKLWHARRSINPACGRLNPTKISEDTTVPRSKIPEMVRRVKEIAQKYNLKMVIFGHAGDGNLHPNILTNKHNHEEMQRVHLAIEELFRVALELGGALSGEHGIGYMKAPFLKWELGEVGYAAGVKIKKAFDPGELINPEKMFIRDR